MNTTRKQAGFTVMELLIVISIVMILSGIAALSISEYRRRTEIREEARALEGFFYDARTAARARQQTVLIDFTPSDGIAYLDQNLSGAPYVSADDTLILTHRMSTRLELLGESDPPGFAVPGTMGFTGLGRLNTTDTRRIIIVRNPSNPARQYRIIVFQTGRTRVEKNEDGGAPASWVRAW